jgi:hypothetical protein
MIKASQTYFVLMDFSALTVSYKRALPIFDNDYLGMSVMLSDIKFYAIAEAARVNVATTTASWKTFSTTQPILLSSDLDESCYSVYTEAYTTYPLSKSVTVSSLTAYNYFSHLTYTGVTLTIITTSFFTNVAAQM